MNFKSLREDTKENPMFWLASICGLIGTILNAYQHVEGFLFWMISNPILMYQAWRERSFNMALMFLVYLALSVLGLVQWSGYGG